MSEAVTSPPDAAALGGAAAPGCDATATSAALLAFCRALPKAELHAHLHGSVRPSTLAELVQAREDLASQADAAAVIRDVLPLPGRSLRDCFRIFDLIHAVVTSEDVLRRITREALEDAATDGVRYLELRTTPRVLALTADPASSGLPAYIATSEQSAGYARYVGLVIEEMEAAEARGLPVTPRLLLSINRTGTLAAATDMLAVAKYYAAKPCAGAGSGGYVVGVELSGDPTRGDARTFLPLLASARACGLRISVHCGEVMNVAETEAILDAAPDRLGHMCVLGPLTVARLLATLSPCASATAAAGARGQRPLLAPIPIEVCPTSNALTLHLPSLHHHPTINPWLEAGYPLAICTDDSGVFDVTLSEEYADVAHTYGLGRARLAQLARASFDYAFADAATMRGVAARVDAEFAAAMALP
jgi:adenosine deaminase